MISVIAFLLVTTSLCADPGCYCGEGQMCCAGHDCNMYSGTCSECYCWVNKQAAMYNITDYKAFYIPEKTGVSEGYCAWCSNEWPHETSKTKKIIYTPYTWCADDNCSRYFGTLVECHSACQAYQDAHQIFVSGFVVDYIQHILGSAEGYCGCRGEAYPCKVPKDYGGC